MFRAFSFFILNRRRSSSHFQEILPLQEMSPHPNQRAAQTDGSKGTFNDRRRGVRSGSPWGQYCVCWPFHIGMVWGGFPDHCNCVLETNCLAVSGMGAESALKQNLLIYRWEVIPGIFPLASFWVGCNGISWKPLQSPLSAPTVSDSGGVTLGQLWPTGGYIHK